MRLLADSPAANPSCSQRQNSVFDLNARSQGVHSVMQPSLCHTDACHLFYVLASSMSLLYLSEMSTIVHQSQQGDGLSEQKNPLAGQKDVHATAKSC